MDAGAGPASPLSLEDIWTPEQPLPAGPTLRRLAGRFAEAWQAQEVLSCVRIGYNPRLRTTAGRAQLAEVRVELNPHLLRDNPGELIPTLAHELAHLVVHRHWPGEAAHGRRFRMLLRAVGMPDERCHQLAVGHLRRRRRRFLYLHQCSGCGIKLVARSVLRSRYCRSCGPGMTWDIHRVPNTPAGQALVRRLVEAGR